MTAFPTILPNWNFNRTHNLPTKSLTKHHPTTPNEYKKGKNSRLHLKKKRNYEKNSTPKMPKQLKHISEHKNFAFQPPSKVEHTWNYSTGVPQRRNEHKK